MIHVENEHHLCCFWFWWMRRFTQENLNTKKNNSVSSLDVAAAELVVLILISWCDIQNIFFSLSSFLLYVVAPVLLRFRRLTHSRTQKTDEKRKTNIQENTKKKYTKFISRNEILKISNHNELFVNRSAFSLSKHHSKVFCWMN